MQNTGTRQRTSESDKPAVWREQPNPSIALLQGSCVDAVHDVGRQTARDSIVGGKLAAVSRTCDSFKCQHHGRQPRQHQGERHETVHRGIAVRSSASMGIASVRP